MISWRCNKHIWKRRMHDECNPSKQSCDWLCGSLFLISIKGYNHKNTISLKTLIIDTCTNKSFQFVFNCCIAHSFLVCFDMNHVFIIVSNRVLFLMYDINAKPALIMPGIQILWSMKQQYLDHSVCTYCLYPDLPALIISVSLIKNIACEVVLLTMKCWPMCESFIKIMHLCL